MPRSAAKSYSMTGVLMFTAYVVGTLVIVFAGLTLYRMGPSDTATYHGTR